jgi:Putative Ig domain
MRTGLAAVLVFLGTFAGLTLAGVTPAGASTLNGLATFANPVTQAHLVKGASTATFTVVLPKVGTVPAKCTGDTATKGYHVFSYMVHVGVKPTTVKFKTGFPSTGFGLVDTTGTYYGKANTASKTGEIYGIPNNLQFAPLLHRGLTLTTLLYATGHKSGAWDVGISCANSAGTMTDYWNTPITFTSSTTDANKFVWAVPVFITTASLPSVKPGGKVSDTLKASGGKAPYTWAITKALPKGLKLSAAGLLSGTIPKTTKAGKYPVDIKVTDTSSPKFTASADFSLTVT